MEDEINLTDIIHVLWKNRILIIGIFVLSILIAGLAIFSMPSIYKASSIIAVGNFGDPVYASQTSVKSIMLNDEFLYEVFNQIRPNETGGEFIAFRDSVKVVPVVGSNRLIEISVETPDGRQSQRAVEMMVQRYANRSEESYYRQKSILTSQLEDLYKRLNVTDMNINSTQMTLMNNIEGSSDSSSVQSEMRFSRALDLLSEMQTQRSSLIDRIQDLENKTDLLRHIDIIQPATEPANPIGPRRALNMAIAGILGLMLGILAAFIKEWLGRPVE